MSWVRPLTALLVLALSASLIVACGGDDGDSKSEVVSKANEICSQAEEQGRDYVDDRDRPDNPDEIDAAFAEDARIANDAATKLEELDPPEDGAEDFDTFVASQKKIAELDKQQSTAADTGASKEFLEASDQILDETNDAKKAADAYGLTDCPYAPTSVLFVRKDEGGGSTATDSTTTESDAGSTDIVGQWIGRVTQYGPGNKSYRYPVEMNIEQLEPNAESGTIRYPSFPCRGQLQLSRESGGRYTFKERISESGVKRCTAGGTITASASGQRLSWRWVGKVGDTKVQVLGSLRRD